MKNKAIGVFDSGLGGLTTVKELRKILPNENIVYFGDTLRVPYGNRSPETIRKYATDDVNFLLKQNVKMIIAACGTVSSVAVDLEKGFNVPFVKVLKPTAEAAFSVTKNKKIGVIGTSATIKTGSYKNELKKLDPTIEVFEKDCPLFVPLVENGFIDDYATTLIAEKYLLPLKDQKIDTLILGCTHYPIIRSTIEMVMGKDINIVDSGKETAKFAAKRLKDINILNDSHNNGKCLFFVSDSVETFSKTANIFLGKTLDGLISKIDINQFSV